MRCVGPSWGWWYMVWGGWWRSMVRSWWGMMRSHWSMVMRGWRMAEVGWRNRVSISAWWTVISGVLEVIMGGQTMMRMASMVCMAMACYFCMLVAVMVTHHTHAHCPPRHRGTNRRHATPVHAPPTCPFRMSLPKER